MRSMTTSGSILAYSLPSADSGGSPPSLPCRLYSLSPWRVSQILRGLPLARQTWPHKAALVSIGAALVDQDVPTKEPQEWESKPKQPACAEQLLMFEIFFRSG